MIPRVDGAILSQAWKEALWDKFVTGAHAVRAAIQRSQAALAQLSKELGINPKTVAKRRKRATVEDLKTGPKEPRSTVLPAAEEAMIVAFRRHEISRLPDVEGDKPKRQKFKRYPIGFFHIDIAEVQKVEGKLYLFVGIARTRKFAVTQIGIRRIARQRGSSSSVCSSHSPIASTQS